MSFSKQSPEITLSSTAGKWILSSTILASSMAFIDSTALNVILPSLQKDLGAEGTDIFWILNSYLLMLAALILVGGSLGDKLGRKKVFMIGIVIFILSSIACGLSPTVEFLIIARGIQGIGGALMIPGSLSIISSTFHHKEKGKAIGSWSAATTLVTVGGPILGGALGDAGLWRGIFFINLPLGIASLCVLHFKVPESSDNSTDRSIDYAGGIAVVVGLALLTFGFLEIPELGWQDWRVIVSLILGILALVIFIRIELRIANPMIPLHLFNNRTFTGSNLLTFFLYGALTVVMLFVSLNMIQIQGYKQVQAGMTFIPFTILMATLARRVGGLVDTYGPKWLLVIGPFITGVGFLWFAQIGLTAGFEDFWTTFLPGIVIFGLGMSLTVVPLTTTVMGSVKDRYAGTASGVNNSMTRTSGVFANAMIGALAVVLFSNFLKEPLMSLNLSDSVSTAVLEQSANLGEAQVPEIVPEGSQVQVKELFRQSFISMFDQITYIGTGLAWISAIFAFFLIDNKAVKEE